MHQFDEKHSAFNGFSPFYFQVIGPRLRDEEAARKAAVKKTLIATPLAVICSAAFITLYYLYAHVSEKGLIYVTAIGLGAPIIPASIFLTPVWTSTKYSLIGGFCRFMKWSFKGDRSFHFSIRHFLELGLIPPHESSSLESLVTGNANGVNFNFFRATFNQSNTMDLGNFFSPQKTSFKGQLISLGFERQFQGQTVVLPDKGIFNRKKRLGMKRVRLVDPVFEKMFEVYGTDQVESRYLLSPDFIQRLVDLEHAFKGKSIRFGFKENMLIIAIETRMRLGSGSLFRPLNDPKRMQSVIDIMASIYDVIDGATKSQERILINTQFSAA